ncbi:MAG: HupE/UreJ family protein [Acidobacteria bacterium]|nr:HupE/UreJ family protein [Acidobacteriota bacterium]
MSLSAHDLGVSSLNLEIVDGKLVVYSSYAKADLGSFAARTSPEDLKAFTANAIKIEVDGKPLDLLENEVFIDAADGLNLRHSFGEVAGKEIRVTSFLPSMLSSNHVQILKLIRNNKEISRQFLTGEKNEFVFDLNDIQTPTTFGQFLTLGIKHITFGLDHLLFLFALLLVVTQFREIAKIATFFTIAHSITLALVVLNVISIPSFLVEPVIALSIIYVGLENIFKPDQKRRWLVAYIFGLVHGLGFASILTEIGIGKGMAAVIPLFSFNLGVELGQFAIILLVLPFLWKLQKQAYYKTIFVPICSILIALAGLYWFVERTL